MSHTALNASPDVRVKAIWLLRLDQSGRVADTGKDTFVSGRAVPPAVGTTNNSQCFPPSVVRLNSSKDFPLQSTLQCFDVGAAKDRLQVSNRSFVERMSSDPDVSRTLAP